jgi:hypothetical protein
MANAHPTLAIAYDFDGTLAPGNMQERDFIPAIGMTTSEFWKEVLDQSKTHNADNILVYMRLMLQKAEVAEVPVRESDFKDFGKGLAFFQGVEDWFDRIDAYGKEQGVKVEHYVISSGIREMVAGTKIARKFKRIYASSFIYDHHGIARWPALVLNYTTKTQYLFASIKVHWMSTIKKSMTMYRKTNALFPLKIWSSLAMAKLTFHAFD